MVPTWTPNVPQEASKWTSRPQDGSGGAKMASRRVQEVSKDSQDGSKDPQHDPRRCQDGPKRGQDGSKMAPRWSQETSQGAKMGATIELSMFCKTLICRQFFQWKWHIRDSKWHYFCTLVSSMTWHDATWVRMHAHVVPSWPRGCIIEGHGAHWRTPKASKKAHQRFELGLFF